MPSRCSASDLVVGRDRNQQHPEKPTNSPQPFVHQGLGAAAGSVGRGEQPSNEAMEAIGPGTVGGLLPPADKPKLWCVRSQRSATLSSPVPLNPTHQNGADQVPPCPCIAARWLWPPAAPQKQSQPGSAAAAMTTVVKREHPSSWEVSES